MSSVNSILGDRAHRITRIQRRRAAMLSAVIHFSIVGGVWAASALQPEAPKRRPRATIVRVVTPAALGIQRPPPPPPKPTPKVVPPPKPTPEVTPPPPKPVSPAPVIPVSRKPAPKPTPKPPASTSTPPPPPPAPTRPRGVLRGNPLGSSNSTAIGIEDPDFTYGYYINQLVAALSSKWRRPPVPERINDARWYFRIQRDGTVTEIRLVDESGSRVFDDAARRAIESATLPPLPRGYTKDYLGITVVMR